MLGFAPKVDRFACQTPSFRGLRAGFAVAGARGGEIRREAAGAALVATGAPPLASSVGSLNVTFRVEFATVLPCFCYVLVVDPPVLLLF